MKVERALISVYKKDGIVEFAKVLTEQNIEILSSGGTARFLRDHNIPVTEISDYTGFPEILGGRVKTLHPKILGGILARRDKKDHLAQLQEQNILPIDLVVVNLYPFLDALRESDKSEMEMLELIDIGGPTLIRSAAKNYPFVGVVIDPSFYDTVARELQETGGKLSDATRIKLARAAFEHTAYYDSAIAGYLTSATEAVSDLPDTMVLPLRRAAKLRYGENPHQKAGFYELPLSAAESQIEQLHGIELSYNNLLDVDAAIQAIQDFDDPTVVIIKHTNPCGVGSDSDLAEAYQKALASDPVSAFGGILVTNRQVTAALTEKLRSHFLEVLIAPDFEPDALSTLRKKKKLRILKFFPNKSTGLNLYVRSALNGVLVQDRDLNVWDQSQLKVVTRREPTEEEWAALAFNWKVVKHVKSNAIVFGVKDRTLGIGAGQMSRVDSVELAVRKAEKAGLNLQGSVMASDAFFPFRDGIDAAAKAGATAVVQPGGSIRDEEVIAAADEHDIAMVFTGIRHFRH